MSKFGERLSRNYQYLSCFSEELLAWTICLPFTFCLSACNRMSDILSIFESLPDNASGGVWRIGKVIILLPLYTLKGAANILFALPAAALWAFVFSTPLRTYSFSFTRFFLGGDSKNIMFIISEVEMRPAEIINYGKYFEFLHFWLAMFYLPEFIEDVVSRKFREKVRNDFLSIWLFRKTYTLASITKNYFFSFRSFSKIFNLVKYYSRKTLFFISGLDDFNFIISTLVPVAKSSLLFVTSIFCLSTVQFIFLFLGLGICLSEGYLENISQFIIAKVQEYHDKYLVNLLKSGKNPFKNQKTLLQDDVQDIPLNRLFVSNTNHVFDLNELNQSVASSPVLLNYYNEKRTALDIEDVKRLEAHPSIGEFPQLVKAIHDRRYKNRLFSQTTLTTLQNLAKALLIQQEKSNFSEKIIDAKMAWEAHFQTLSLREKERLKQLNTLGGVDSEYNLDNLLDKVYSGDFCKQAAGRLIQETIIRITKDNLTAMEEQAGIIPVFWRRQHPTHWANFHLLRPRT